MQPTHTPDYSQSRPPTIGGLSMLVGFVLIGGVISTFILLGIILIARGMDMAGAQAYLTQLALNPAKSGSGWYELMLLQAINHLGTFLLPALAYWYLIERRTWDQFNRRPLWAVAALGTVSLIVIAFMPFDGLVIEWNQNIHLPQTLAPLEQWIRDKEKSLEGITRYLTTFSSPTQLIVALLVIAVIPGIGEEVLFRGILQRNISYWTRNVHVGIWLSAILFSAIHIQFLGFVPRMLLGALFGYLYVWSGNLWVPIFAHFVNNGFTVVMVYMHQRKMVSVDIENNELVPVWGAMLLLGLTLGLMYFFKQRNQAATTDR
jgi:membrane protease YdiL (CAAX protease family)